MRIRKVLMIGSDEDAICFWKKVVESCGMRLIWSDCAADGIFKFLQHQPMIVIVDMRLEDWNGISLSEYLVSREVRGLMLLADNDAGESTEALRQLAEEACIDAVVDRPFEDEVARLEFLDVFRKNFQYEWREEVYEDISDYDFSDDDISDDDIKKKLGAGKKPVVDEAPQSLHLTRTEYEVFLCLAERPGTVFTYTELSQRVWGCDMEYPLLHTIVKSLRRKLGEGEIRTEVGVGYFLPRECKDF